MATSSTKLQEVTASPNGSRVESIRVADVQADDAYQREPKTWLVQDIHHHYDARAFGLPTISRREDGSLWVIDGLQRLTAAGWLDMESVDCEVFEGLTREQEADLRLKKNRRQNETSVERFKAKLAMKDKDALGLLKVCRDYELFIAVDVPEPLRDRAVHSIGAFEKLYGMDGGVELRRILGFMQLTVGEVKAVHVTSNHLWMLHWLFSHHDKFDEKRMQRSLKLHFTGLKQIGKLYAAQYGGSVWVNMYRALLEFYNEGAKSPLVPLMRGYRGVAGGPSASE